MNIDERIRLARKNMAELTKIRDGLPEGVEQREHLRYWIAALELDVADLVAQQADYARIATKLV